MQCILDTTLTGGNQRDLARQKAAQKQKDSSKGLRHDGVDPKARKEHDAEILRMKQQKDEEKKVAEQAAAAAALIASKKK